MEHALQSQNPLASFMRQPKIYIKLPSNGNFWAPGALQMPASGELPVFSMTAKDELMLKVPDALLNGQAVVDVIEHCIPCIKNAWEIPSIDLDVILIAIRIATYGEKMTLPIHDNIDIEYDVDLRMVLDSLLKNISWDTAIPVTNDLTVFVKPLNYQKLAKSAIQTFETQKILQVANNDAVSQDDKIKIFKDSFKKLTEVTVDVVTNSVYRIDSSQGSTDNPIFIKEFIDNTDKDVFNVIHNHLERLKAQNSVKPMSIPVTEEMREQGITGETLEIPLVFDPAAFFG